MVTYTLLSMIRLDRDNGLGVEERQELWKKVGDMGLFGITTTSQYGGSDMTMMDQVGELLRKSQVSRKKNRKNILRNKIIGRIKEYNCF